MHTTDEALRQTVSCWDFHHVSPTAHLRQISAEPIQRKSFPVTKEEVNVSNKVMNVAM